MAKWMVTNPAGWVIAIVGAFAGAIVTIDAFTESLDEAAEAANDAKERYNTISSEIESLNSKIEENKRLISQTNNESYYEGYRKRLQAENKELERQIDLKKIEASEVNKEADKKATKVLTDESYEYDKKYSVNGAGFGYTVTSSKKGDISDITDWYLDQAEETGIVDKALEGYIDTITEQRDNLNLLNPESKELYDQLGLLIDRYIALYPEIVLTSDETKTFSENINKISLDNLINVSNSISSISNAYKELSDNGYITLDTLASIQEATGLSGDAWSEYEDKLINAKFGSQEFNSTLAQLAREILESKIGLNGLTNATDEQISTILRENGVINAGASAIKSLSTAYAEAQTAMTKVANSGALTRLGITEAELSGIDSIAEAYSLIAQKTPGGSVAQFDAMFGEDLAKLIPFIETKKKIQEIFDSFEFKVDTPYSNNSLDNALSNAEKSYKIHQDELRYISDLQNAYDTLTNNNEERANIEETIEQARKDYANNRISDIQHEIELLTNAGAEESDLIKKYREIQETAHAEAERLRNDEGYDDNSTEIQELQRIWWDAQSKIVEANEKIIASIDETVAEANELLDGFQNVYTTLTDVAKEYNTNGYLSADSLQSILELGPKYLDYLYDENGQLVVNKQALENIIAAQTEEMAVQAALAYSKQILAAAEKGDIQALTNLTQVTANSSDATWDMAYATIALAKAIGTANGMDASYFDDAYSSIVKMQDMTDLAVNSMSRYYDTLEEGYISEKDGLDKILELTQEMIKWENEQKIEALENEKKAYQDIINKKKEMLQLAKEESEHEDSISEKLQNIAELQSKIEQLSLDESREAQAQKKGLEEELGELQKELADEQADYAVDAQIDALDRELEEFELAKDKEIAEQEAMLDSTEELYQAAIERIDTDWDGLYFDLLAWNAQYGSSLESDIVAAWHAASAAVQE